MGAGKPFRFFTTYKGVTCGEPLAVSSITDFIHHLKGVNPKGLERIKLQFPKQHQESIVSQLNALLESELGTPVDVKITNLSEQARKVQGIFGAAGIVLGGGVAAYVVKHLASIGLTILSLSVMPVLNLVALILSATVALGGIACLALLAVSYYHREEKDIIEIEYTYAPAEGASAGKFDAEASGPSDPTPTVACVRESSRATRRHESFQLQASVPGIAGLKTSSQKTEQTVSHTVERPIAILPPPAPHPSQVSARASADMRRLLAAPVTVIGDEEGFELVEL